MAASILTPSAIYGSTDTTEHVQKKVCLKKFLLHVEPGKVDFILHFGLKKGEGGSTKC